MRTSHLLVCLLLLFSLGCIRSYPTAGVPRTTRAVVDGSSTVAPSVVPSAAPTVAPEPSPPLPTCNPQTEAFQPSGPAAPSSPTPTLSSQGPAPSLRVLATKRGLRLGAAVQPYYQQDPAYGDLLRREMNMLTPEIHMSWRFIHPQPLLYDFSLADDLVSFAEANDMAVYGHVLVWDSLLPDWVESGVYSRAEWMDILCTHIKTVVGRYAGHIYAWNVVNEAFDEQGQLRDTLWLRAIGPEYIALAFQWAHEADPQALLVYNDHESEGLNQKSQAVYALATGLLQTGIPIHAIGFQMHIWLWGPPAPGDMATNMRRLANLGLQVHITEMDVRTQYDAVSEQAKLAAQAEMYRQVLEVCLSAPNCTVFTTWGLTDRYSWIPGYTGNPDQPLLFDEKGQPKPAYFAIQALLSQP